MKKTTIYNLVFTFLGLTLMSSCGTKENQNITETKVIESPIVEVKIEAEDLVNSSTNFDVVELDGVSYISFPSEGWVEVDVNIPETGSYKTELKISTPSDKVTCWVEDFVDNTEGRTFNITGRMIVDDANFSSVYKDGSPFEKGIHKKMKIHFDGPVNIDWIKFTLIAPLYSSPENLTQKMDGKEWKVVWADEFEGTELDTTKWTYDIGNWGWGNMESQYYTFDRKENARVEDGNLIIEARKHDMGQEWTSARITTRGKTSFTYGKIEFKAKIPVKKGSWAAGWTLGDSFVHQASWPECGEIDILETVGYEIDNVTGDGVAHASVHCKAYYHVIGNHKTFTVDVDNMNAEYHIYSVEWTPEKIIGYVDGVAYSHYENTGEIDAWPFDKPQNIILNLAIGGWGGRQGISETIVSQKMIVDYIRVYDLQ